MFSTVQGTPPVDRTAGVVADGDGTASVVVLWEGVASAGHGGQHCVPPGIG
jgi:hypothetical protein